MAGNYGDLIVEVRAASNLAVVGTISHCLSARGKHLIDGIGTGEVVIPLSAKTTVNGVETTTNVMSILNKGDIIYARAYNQVAAIAVGGYAIDEICVLVIDDVSFDDSKPDVPLIRVKGPDILHELLRRSLGTGVIDDGAGGNATNDIQQVIDTHPQWTANTSGTTNGSYIVTTGRETTFDGLKFIREQNGGHFRRDVAVWPWMSSPELYWRRVNYYETYDTSPVVLRIPTDPSLYEATINSGIITRFRQRTRGREIYTRVTVSGSGLGGDAFLFTAASGYVTVPPGFTVNWASGQIINDTLEATGYPITEKHLSFPSIKPGDDTATTERTAAIALFNAGLGSLQAHGVESQVYDIQAVVYAEATNPLEPSQLIRLIYSFSNDDGVVVSIDDYFLLLAVERVYTSNPDQVIYNLQLANVEGDYLTPSWISGADRMVREQADIKRTIAYSSGTGTGAPGSAVDHGALTGLADDDHTQYLRADGGRNLVGNLTVGFGYTIDGVDLDVHAGNADAHHPRIHAIDGSDHTGQLDHSSLSGLTDSNHHNPATSGSGITVSAGQTVTLNTPGTLSDSSVNAAAGNHTHAVSASSNPGAAASLLKTDSGGNLTLSWLTVTNDLDVLGNLTVGNNVGSHLIPTLTDTYDLGSSTNLWRHGWLSELDTILFAENTITLLGGWFIVSKDAGTVNEDVDTTETVINFGKTMTPGDIVVFRSSLTVEYMSVDSLVAGDRYNVTRDLDGSGANAWADGSPFLVLGQTGDGRIEFSAYTTPKIQILEQGAAYNTQTELIRFGDLNGNWGYTSEEFGAALGEYAANMGNLTWDATNGLRLRSYTQTVIQFDTAGNARFEGPMTFGSAGGIWQGTGTFASPTTGIKMWNDGGIGRIGGYGGGSLNWYGATDGRFYAGNGDLVMDNLGLYIKSGPYSNVTKQVTWWNGSVPGSGVTDGFVVADTSGFLRMEGRASVALAISGVGYRLQVTSTQTILNNTLYLLYNGLRVDNKAAYPVIPNSSTTDFRPASYSAGDHYITLRGQQGVNTNAKGVYVTVLFTNNSTVGVRLYSYTGSAWGNVDYYSGNPAGGWRSVSGICFFDGSGRIRVNLSTGLTAQMNIYMSAYYL